jgi:hypothetical protein
MIHSTCTKFFPSNHLAKARAWIERNTGQKPMKQLLQGLSRLC